MEILELIFRSFWHFLGSLILISMVFGGTLRFLAFLWNRFWRHWNIRKHGYPPAWCDADGDFRPVEKHHKHE
jgi:hypothetical protein